MQYINHYARNYNEKYTKKACFPNFQFYCKAFKIVTSAAMVVRKGKYDASDWVKDSYLIGQALESVGTDIMVEGYEHVENLDKPCIFISNHMSTLETFLLPSMIQPTKDVTFIVKDSLLKYPWLGAVLRTRDPIALTRTDPRKDLANVLETGKRILESGRSIILFPQGTRFSDVNASDFSSLGVKLAKKAGVPIIPLALKTDAWGINKITKNFGCISPNIPVRFRFSAPLEITGNGKEEHAKCMEFIIQTFQEFSRESS